MNIWRWENLHLSNTNLSNLGQGKANYTSTKQHKDLANSVENRYKKHLLATIAIILRELSAYRKYA